MSIMMAIFLLFIEGVFCGSLIGPVARPFSGPLVGPLGGNIQAVSPLFDKQNYKSLPNPVIISSTVSTSSARNPPIESYCLLLKEIVPYNQFKREDYFDDEGENIVSSNYTLKNIGDSNDKKILIVNENFIFLRDSTGQGKSIGRSVYDEFSRKNCECMRSLANVPKAGNFIKREANKKCSNVLCAQEARKQMKENDHDSTFEELWNECFKKNEHNQFWTQSDSKMKAIIEEVEIDDGKGEDIKPL